MKNQINFVALTGIAGKDLKITPLADGKKVARVSIAVNEYYNAADGPKQVTNWLNLVFWNSTVDEAKKIVKKGAKLIVEGRLKTNVYTKKADQKGKEEKRYEVEIIVEKISGE